MSELIVSGRGVAHRESDPSFYVSRSPWLTDRPSQGVSRCGRWIDLHEIPVKRRCLQCWNDMPGAQTSNA